MPEPTFRRDFVAFACASGVLRFGHFVTKSGRASPYFFNAGLFHDGAALARLCGFYADALAASGCACDMLFGPAYKGIALAAGLAMTCAQRGRNLPFAFNRKEAKDHGEGGVLIGAPLAGRVLIVDDVITAGVSVRESVALIRAAGAQPCAVLIALDRQERGQGSLSAVQEVEREYGLPVIAVARLSDLMEYLGGHSEMGDNLAALKRYKENYGVE